MGIHDATYLLYSPDFEEKEPMITSEKISEKCEQLDPLQFLWLYAIQHETR